MIPLLLTLISPARAEDLLLTHARLWDGTGAAVMPDTTLLVRDGHIAAIGPPPADTTGLRVVDLAGATVLPGLIDSHVHLVSNPGAAWREDPEDLRQQQLKEQMAALVACGVTTIMSPGTFLPRQIEADAWRAAGGPGPEDLHTGVALSPKGGYLDRAFPGYPSIADEDALRRQLDDNKAAGAWAVKVALEPGFAEGGWPIFDATMRAAIVRESAARDLKVAIHATTPEMLDLALDMKPYLLVHTAAPLDDARADRVAASGAWVTSTLLVNDMWHHGREPERLARPLLDVVVPKAELETARQPQMYDRFMVEMFNIIASSKPPWYRRIGERMLNNPRYIRRREVQIWDALKMLRARGVRAVMGSDSGNWPLIPYLFHGPSSLREMELLQKAGLSPTEALQMATSNPAKMMGISDRVGTVEVGKEADLMIVRGDPLTDLSALWTVAWTVNDGVMHSPEEWMALSRAAAPTTVPTTAPTTAPAEAPTGG